MCAEPCFTARDEQFELDKGSCDQGQERREAGGGLMCSVVADAKSAHDASKAPTIRWMVD